MRELGAVGHGKGHCVPVPVVERINRQARSILDFRMLLDIGSAVNPGKCEMIRRLKKRCVYYFPPFIPCAALCLVYAVAGIQDDFASILADLAVYLNVVGVIASLPGAVPCGTLSEPGPCVAI